MNTKLTSVSIVCIAVAAAGFTLWRSRQSSVEATARIEQLDRELEQKRSEVTALKKSAASATAVVPMTAASDTPNTTPAAPQARDTTLEKSRNEAVARMLKQKRFEVMADFKPFIDRLPQDKADEFKRLLLAERVDPLEQLMQAQAAGASLADQKDLLGKARADAEGKIKDLLGNDDYQAYADFAKVLPSVKAVEAVSERMYAANVPLNEDQRSGLTQAVIAATPKTSLDVRNTDLDTARVTYRSNLENASNTLIAKSSGVLNETQITVLREYENDQIEKALASFDRLARRTRQR